MEDPNSLLSFQLSVQYKSFCTLALAALYSTANKCFFNGAWPIQYTLHGKNDSKQYYHVTIFECCSLSWQLSKGSSWELCTEYIKIVQGSLVQAGLAIT